MWLAKTKAELRKHLRQTGRPLVLVPTMGALHPAHASLISLAREKAGSEGTVIVSIFVNPIQFDKKADLANYPRPLEADLAVCKTAGADGVFAPDASEMYQPGSSTKVIESTLSEHLCGATRPGHFDGVCTVVLKLFNLTRCDAAVFGEKDFQQLAIIRRMLRDLDLEVVIIPHPTMREPDGLAMSSRNVRLTAEHRADASRIHQALKTAATKKSSEDILKTAKSIFIESPFAKIDYLNLVDSETLAPTTNLEAPTSLACAVIYGEVRLIDHMDVPPTSSQDPTGRIT